jgi:hypothetical protein
MEHGVIRNRESVLGIRDSLYIRRCRADRKFKTRIVEGGEVEWGRG